MENQYPIKPPQVVQLRERGQLTIPADIRREMGAREGDVFSVVLVGDSLVVTRKRFVTAEVARTIETLLQESGLTLEDLLAEAERQRENYTMERYGQPA